MVASFTLPSPGPFQIGGWLWATGQDRADWWRVATGGVKDRECQDRMAVQAKVTVVGWAVTLAAGILRGERAEKLVLGMGVQTVLFGLIWSEVSWRMLWMERCFAAWPSDGVVGVVLLSGDDGADEDEGSTATPGLKCD